MRIITLFLLISVLEISPQQKVADELINSVINNYNRVKDYEVDVEIKVDVDFLRVPDSKAKIYFKQPDKIRLKSEGFALLPKEGLDFSPASLIKKDYTAIYEQDVMLNGRKSSMVKIIPIGEQSNTILSTLWIDPIDKVIRKVESTTKTNGTFTIELYYNDSLKYPLPEKMVFSFSIDKLNLPKVFSNEGNSSSRKRQLPDGPTKGSVIVKYLNYKVNIGIPDSVFEEKQ
ncbi:MAG: LolA family protein [Ignavibacterium sp.]|uniref:LolA family protein n=1 Tax=Ignavibacterium sp. TaxID=2651167 RepID=UPI00404A6F40